MALSEAQKIKAQQEAREFLEYSILTLASILGILVSDIDDEYVVPVGEDDQYYEAHLALSRQVAALSLLP